MARELAYVWITPYSLLKSRTGGILGRLLSTTDFDLVGAHLYAPSDEFVDRYNKTIEEADMEAQIRGGLLTYMNEHFRANNRLGIVNRAILLLVEGDQVIHTLKQRVVGSLTQAPHGDSIRGTYGDYIGYLTGELKYFEPAVLTATSEEMNRKQLALFAEYAVRDGGCLEHLIRHDDPSRVETTLVIIKPEQFARRSPMAGNVIDTFSRTGLYLVGARVLRMTVAQAEEFYAPLRSMFLQKLRGQVAPIMEQIQTRFSCLNPDHRFRQISEVLYDLNAENEFNRIIEYMSGRNPAGLSREQKSRPGGAKCLALLYQGMDAVSKIRETLGATDPSKAAAGTVRSSYGTDLMRNSAHASDSVASAERERAIIGLAAGQKDWDIVDLVRSYLRG
ncbi:MAG: nucleoside-diphosphate kinase [Planctomycetes bacterium]|nr:nucleoside-diphosphate kinase [Planctomycetota bacterium]